LLSPGDREPRTRALSDRGARTVDLLPALPEPNRRWTVWLWQQAWNFNAAPRQPLDTKRQAYLFGNGRLGVGVEDDLGAGVGHGWNP